MIEQSPEERVAAIKARAEAATEGPWQHQPYGGQNQNGDYFGGWIFDEPTGEYVLSEISDHDGAFIAHSRSDAPWLVEERERLQAEVATLRQQVDGALANLDEKNAGIIELGTQNATLLLQRHENLQAIAARDAVIADIQALHREKHGEADRGPYVICDYDKTPWPCKTQGILSTAPADILAARDAEKWDEGHEAGEGYVLEASSFRFNPYRAGAEQ